MYCTKCGRQIPENSVCSACNPAAKPLIPARDTATNATHAPSYTAPSSPPTVDKGIGLGIAALLVGIFSATLGLLHYFDIISIGYFIPEVCAALGAILGAVSINKSRKSGVKNTIPAIVGLIISGVVFSIFSFLLGEKIGEIIGQMVVESLYNFY